MKFIFFEKVPDFNSVHNKHFLLRVVKRNKKKAKNKENETSVRF